MRRKLTSWRVALRRWSNQIILVAGSMPVFWLSIPDDWRRAVLEWHDGIIVLGATALALASFVVSNIRQPSIQKEMKEAYIAADEDDG